MTRQKILSELFHSEKVEGCISKMEPAHLREDLMGELMLVLCELPEERLLEMYHKKYLEFYSIRTVLNMVRSDRSGFHRKYLRSPSELQESHFQTVDIAEEEMDPPNISQLYWAEEKVLKLLAEHGSIAAVSRETGISEKWLRLRLSRGRGRIKMEQNAKTWIFLTVPMAFGSHDLLDGEELKVLIESLGEEIRKRLAAIPGIFGV